jgi:hypothetical protein
MLPKTDKVAAFSAHKSTAWADFVMQSFDDAHVTYHGSQWTKIGRTQESNINAECCQGVAE